MAEQDLLEFRVTRLEQRVDHMSETLATLATKDDLKMLADVLREDTRSFREDMKSFREDMRSFREDMKSFREETREDMRSLREDTREDIESLRADNRVLHGRINNMNVLILGAFTVTVASVIITRLLT